MPATRSGTAPTGLANPRWVALSPLQRQRCDERLSALWPEIKPLEVDQHDSVAARARG
jgi:hypothetical protein